MIPIAQPLIDKEEIAAVTEVLASGILASGPRVQEFEKRFAEYVGTKYAVATASGTAALHLSLLALGVHRGDEVIVPSFSFIASANSILYCQGRPVFCDVDPQSFTIDVAKIGTLITDATKVILPVHLYGQPVDLAPVVELAEQQGVSVVFDAAQAHGAEYHGHKIGSFGVMECFSFYPTKNMITGEGGMITTNDSGIADRLCSLRNHGRENTAGGYDHGRLGFNFRMTDVAAAIGLVQLKKLPKFIEMRRRNAAFLTANLGGIAELRTPVEVRDVRHVYHQYTVLCAHRDRLIGALRRNDIGFGVYYPKPLHVYPHLKRFAHGDLKQSEKVACEVLSLPVHPGLTSDDLERIVQVVSGVFQPLCR